MDRLDQTLSNVTRNCVCGCYDSSCRNLSFPQFLKRINYEFPPSFPANCVDAFLTFALNWKVTANEPVLKWLGFEGPRKRDSFKDLLAEEGVPYENFKSGRLVLTRLTLYHLFMILPVTDARNDKNNCDFCTNFMLTRYVYDKHFTNGTDLVDPLYPTSENYGKLCVIDSDGSGVRAVVLRRRKRDYNSIKKNYLWRHKNSKVLLEVTHVSDPIYLYKCIRTYASWALRGKIQMWGTRIFVVSSSYDMRAFVTDVCREVSELKLCKYVKVYAS